MDSSGVIVACVTALVGGANAFWAWRAIRQKTDLELTDRLDKRQHDYIDQLKDEVAELKEKVERLQLVYKECLEERDRQKDKILNLLIDLREAQGREV